MNKAATTERMMSPVTHPGRAARTRQGALAWQTATSARHAALFASGLQRSDAPGAEMVAAAIKATVRQFGINGCVGRMAQEFGDHPEAAAERMRWICQLAAETPAWPPRKALLAKHPERRRQCVETPLAQASAQARTNR